MIPGLAHILSPWALWDAGYFKCLLPVSLIKSPVSHHSIMSWWGSRWSNFLFGPLEVSTLSSFSAFSKRVFAVWTQSSLFHQSHLQACMAIGFVNPIQWALCIQIKTHLRFSHIFTHYHIVTVLYKLMVFSSPILTMLTK